MPRTTDSKEHKASVGKLDIIFTTPDPRLRRRFSGWGAVTQEGHPLFGRPQPEGNLNHLGAGAFEIKISILKRGSGRPADNTRHWVFHGGCKM
jgi:hypothetical protein